MQATVSTHWPHAFKNTCIQGPAIHFFILKHAEHSLYKHTLTQAHTLPSVVFKLFCSLPVSLKAPLSHILYTKRKAPWIIEGRRKEDGEWTGNLCMEEWERSGQKNWGTVRQKWRERARGERGELGRRHGDTLGRNRQYKEMHERAEMLKEGEETGRKGGRGK